MKKGPLFIIIVFLGIFGWMYVNRVELPENMNASSGKDSGLDKSRSRERSILDRNRKNTPVVNRRSLFNLSAKVSMVKMTDYVEEGSFIIVVAESESRERLGNFLDDLVNRRAIRDIVDHQIAAKRVDGRRIYQATYKFK